MSDEKKKELETVETEVQEVEEVVETNATDDASPVHDNSLVMKIVISVVGFLILAVAGIGLFMNYVNNQSNKAEEYIFTIDVTGKNAVEMLELVSNGTSPALFTYTPTDQRGLPQTDIKTVYDESKGLELTLRDFESYPYWDTEYTDSENKKSPTELPESLIDSKRVYSGCLTLSPNAILNSGDNNSADDKVVTKALEEYMDSLYGKEIYGEKWKPGFVCDGIDEFGTQVTIRFFSESETGSTDKIIYNFMYVAN